MNGTSSLISAGVTSAAASMPHDFADAMRRRSSSIRSSVRATSMPPHSVKTSHLAVLARAVDRERRHLLGVVDREDEVRRVAGRAAGVGQRALVDLHDVGPAEPRQVVGEAVADDAAADDDGSGLGAGRSLMVGSWLLDVVGQRTMRIACSKPATWRAHGGFGPRRRRRRGSPRAGRGARAPRPRGSATRSRARNQMRRAQHVVLARARARGTGCARSGRRAGGCAGRARSGCARRRRPRPARASSCSVAARSAGVRRSAASAGGERLEQRSRTSERPARSPRVDAGHEACRGAGRPRPAARWRACAAPRGSACGRARGAPSGRAR